MKCGVCAGCVGMGPCDDELGRQVECGECALEADHFPEPCAWVCGECDGRGVDCTNRDCEGGLVSDAA